MDEPGKRVCLKVDNGPGRNGRSLLLKMRFKGWYMYPGLPNATSVQQETDINYGPFKTAVRLNLKRIADACFSQRKSLSLRQSTFGLIVYGGLCPDSGIVCENALQSAFSVGANLNSWSKVGAVPFTQKCLTNQKIRHDGTDTNDPLYDVYTDIQQKNDYATTQLNVMGYVGDVLKAEFLPDRIRERQDRMAPVTVEGDRDRQEALLAANTAGKMFHLTGGQHMTEDDDRRLVPVHHCTRARMRNDAIPRQCRVTTPIQVVTGEDWDGPRLDRLEHTEALGVVSRGG